MKKIYYYKKVKSLYINNIEKIDLVNISKDTKMANRKQVIFKSIHNISI